MLLHGLDLGCLPLLFLHLSGLGCVLGHFGCRQHVHRQRIQRHVACHNQIQVRHRAGRTLRGVRPNEPTVRPLMRPEIRISTTDMIKNIQNSSEPASVLDSPSTGFTRASPTQAPTGTIHARHDVAKDRLRTAGGALA